MKSKKSKIDDQKRTVGYKSPPVQVPDTTWHVVFLSALRVLPVVSYAGRAAKVSRATLYNHREMFPEFANEWDEAINDGIDALEAECFRRAKQTSDTLAIFMLKSHRPKIYRETAEQQHSGKVEIVITREDRKPTN